MATVLTACLVSNVEYRAVVLLAADVPHGQPLRLAAPGRTRSRRARKAIDIAADWYRWMLALVLYVEESWGGAVVMAVVRRGYL